VAAHDFADGCGVGWGSGDGCGLGDGGDFSEVGGAEDAGGDDGEGGGGLGVEVIEAVDDSAGDAEDVAGADLGREAVDGHGEDAIEAVDGFFVGVVAVSGGDFGSGSNVEFEHGDGVVRGGAFEVETDDYLAEADLFFGHWWILHSHPSQNARRMGHPSICG
jgi:hypothetical protein